MLPYFSLFIIIYTRPTEKIPYSLDKSEPGLNFLLMTSTFYPRPLTFR